MVPKVVILKEDFQLGIIAFRILIIPQPNPKLCASEKKAPMVSLALVQANSQCPAQKSEEDVKEDGES